MERIDGEGNVMIPLDAEEVEKVLDEVGREGVDSLAVGLLNSHANPGHEEKVLRMMRRRRRG